MTLWGDDYKRVLLLQLRRYRPVLHLSLEGPLGQKNRTSTPRIVEGLRQQITRSLTDFRWSSVPRAKMAVSMTFFASKPQPPAVQNLVKFYMDELQEHAFTDDRQVACVEAEIWKEAPREGVADADKVYIKVERLADYKRRFDAAFALERELSLEPEREYDMYDEIDPDLLGTSSFLPRELADSVRRMAAVRKQNFLLGLNRIEPEDRPGLRRNGVIGATSKYVLDLPSPFTVDVGTLPKAGETKAYKEQIRARFTAFKNRYPRLSSLTVPVVLDVAVSASGPHTSKDLDNIMRDIAPIFTDEFLVPPAFLQGYRIYVRDSLRDDLQSDAVRIKILPQDVLHEFRRHQDEILGKAREEIDLG